MRREQNKCVHNWAEPQYDPEIQPVPEFEERWQGVDCFPVICGWKEKKIARWSRTCKYCGKVEYTKESVVVKTAPKF